MIKTVQVNLLQRIRELEEEFEKPIPDPTKVIEYRACLRELVDLTKNER